MYFAEVAEYIDEALKSGGKLTFYCIRNTVIQKNTVLWVRKDLLRLLANSIFIKTFSTTLKI